MTCVILISAFRTQATAETAEIPERQEFILKTRRDFTPTSHFAALLISLFLINLLQCAAFSPISGRVTEPGKV